MYKIISIVALLLYVGVLTSCQSTKVTEMTEKNYSYEEYCDSIWETNPAYYIDILVETDEYQTYINKHGEWFE